MAGLEDLYREIILDHYRSPRNKGELASPPALRGEGFNPLCGDEIVVTLAVDDDNTVKDIAFTGQGCSISQASASMMTAAVKGRTRREVAELTRAFKAMMSIHEASLDGDGPGEGDGLADDPGTDDEELRLGDLEALRGVVKFPVRIKCATLGWNTLAQALAPAPTEAEAN
jgi:nitrogen fixation NifU-like protein